MERGQKVWTKKLHGPSFAKGSQILKQYGSYNVKLWQAMELTVREAKKNWRCGDCGQSIPKGTLHGSDFYTHRCLNCVVSEEPQERVEK